MSITHIFKKRPSERYIESRTVSFAADSEIKYISLDDRVMIDVYTSESTKIRIVVSGEEFLNNLTNRTSRDGTSLKIFKF